MATSSSEARAPRSLAEGLAAALAFLLPAGLYAATLAPTVTFEDSGSFIAAAVHLGVAHPPGYPLWCLVAHAFTLLPFLEVAERVHLSSAVLAAATTGFTYLVARRLTGQIVPALSASLALATSRVLWSQAVIAEVYTLNAFLTILPIYLVLRWREEGRDRWLYATALCFGLSLANHPMIALVLPVVAVWGLALDWRGVLTARRLAACTLLVAAGLSVYLYLPLRAASDPPVNWGRPDSVSKAIAHVRRDRYQTADEQIRFTGATADVLAHTGEAWRATGEAFGWPLSMLAVAGFVSLAWRRRDLAAVSLAIALGNTLVLNALLHAPANRFWLAVHRVYYIPTHLMTALWLAAGAALLLALAERLGRPGRLAALAALAVLVAVQVPVGRRAAEPATARDFALDFLDSLPPGAGILPLGDEVVFPVAYLKWVEGLRPDVQILSEDFGWNGEEVAVVASPVPLGRRLVDETPAFSDAVAIPHGLAYLLSPAASAPPHGLASFTALSAAPRDPPPAPLAPEPLVESARATYAAYHARLGAKLAARGLRSAGETSFRRAEELAGDDPFVLVLLSDLLGELGMQPQRRAELLGRARDAAEQRLDAAAHRYYPIQPADIDARLAALAEEARGGDSRHAD